jgi:hypothetical protein
MVYLYDFRIYGGYQMKINRWKLLVLIMLIILLGSCERVQSVKYFGPGGGGPAGGVINIVIGNKVELYEFYRYNNTWVEKPEYEFILPNDYKDVFSVDVFSMNVVVGNKVKTYFLDRDNNSWVELPEYEFTLPNGYKRVFGTRGTINVVVGNKVKEYRFNGYGNNKDTWVESSELEFTLPNGYRSVFGIGLSIHLINVVVGNKVKVYEFNIDSNTWVESPEYELTLPKGYKGVFGEGGWSGWGGGRISVVMDNNINIYTFNRENNTWVERPEYKFQLK